MGVADRYKNRKQTEEKTSAKSGGVEYRYKAKKAQSVAEEISSRLSNLEKYTGGLLENYNTRYFDEEGKFIETYRADYQDWDSTVEKHKNYYDQEANYIKNLLDEYSDFFDKDAISKTKESLELNSGHYSDIVSHSKKDIDYFSKFKTEDDFKKRIAALEQHEKMRAEDVSAGMEEVNSILGGEELTSLKAEKEVLEKGIKLSKRDNGVYLRKNGYDKSSAKKKLSEIEEQISNIEGSALQKKDYLTQAKYLQNYYYLTENDVSLEEIESHLNDEDRIAYTDQDGKNITWQKVYDDKKFEQDFNAMYGKYSSNPDWAEKSKFASQAKPKEQLINVEDFGTDLELEYMYGDEEFRGMLTNARYGQAVINNSAGTRSMYDYGAQYGYDSLEDKEKELATYLKYTDTNAYNDYMKFLGDKLMERHNQEATQRMYEIAQEYPVGSSILSVGYSMAGGAEFLVDAATGELDEGNQNAALSSSIRKGVSDTVDWEIGNWDAFDFLYNTGMSMVDSTVAMGTMGSLGGVALGLSAAGQGVNDALDRGLTSKDAFWSGVASGAFEMLFETVSIGQFNALKDSLGSGGRAIAKNIAKSMLVNASEETLTEIANITYDGIANADFSNYETMVRAYVMQGMSPEKAQEQAKRDMRHQIVEAMASGALMGFGFGGIGAVSAHKNAKAIEGKFDAESVNALIEEGLSVPGSEAYELAQKAQAKLSEGKSLSAQELIDLQQANEKAFGEADISKMTQAAEARLLELGEGASASALADIIARQAAGEKLTSSEKLVLKNSKYGQRVANEMSPENISSGNYSSAWAQDIGTDRINTEAYNMGLYDLAQEIVSEPKTEEVAPQTSVGLSDPFSPDYVANVAKEYQDRGLSPEEAKMMAIAQLSNADQGQSSPTAENSTESKYEVSAEGKTINKNTDEIVSVQKIESVSGNGEANLTLDDGMVVKASDLSFGSEAEAIFVESIGAIKVGKNPISTDSANALYHTAMSALKDNPNMTADEAMSLIKGLEESYIYGTYNLGRSKLTSKNEDGTSVLFAGELSQEQIKFAYELGNKDSVNKTEAAQMVIDRLKEKAKPIRDASQKSLGKIVYENGANVDESALTEIQKANLDGIKLLAQLSSVEFHVFKSDKVGNKFKYTMPDGTVTGANGWFVAGTNEIWVDLNAGNFGEGTMLRTAAHEISHYIKQWSPTKWKAMADLLMEEFAKNGVDTEGMLNRQIAKIKRRYTKKNMPSEAVLKDMAHEELVSDALSDMLTDGSIVNFIAEVKAKDRNLAQKIMDAIKSLLKKWGLVIDSYKGRELDTPEAKALSQLEDTFKKLQKMYRDAFMDANEVVATIGARNLADFAEAKNTDGETLFQYRAMEADESTYRDMLRKWGKMTDTQIDNLFSTIDRAMDIIKDNLEVLDYAWESDIDDRAFSPVKPNSDSLYQVSLDFSTLCRKRILQQTIQAQLQEALNQPLSREEGIAIRDALIALQEEGRQIEVACALCYVESARMKSPAQIKKFLSNREAVLRDFFAGKAGGSTKDKIKQAEVDTRENLHKENPNGIKGKDGSMLDPRTASLKAMPKKYADAIRDAKRAAKESYKPTAEEQKLIDVAKSMTVSDFTSPEGLENLAKNYPALFDAYTSYVRNATKSKGIEGDTWWRAGDSAKIGDVLIANMNRENGLRSQSWSDFQVIHILDYIASTIELSTRNAKEQAYSKVPDYVELMGQTGVMINMSLIPTRDFNGSLDYDSVEGMAYERALELREKYPATAGTICIGIDNKQIQKLLADATIDYVIPYHKSGMAAAIRKLMHIPTWSQYEEYQSEKNLSRKDAEAQAKKYGVKLLAESDPNYQKHTSFSEWFDLEVAKKIAKMENANPANKAMQKKYGVMYGGYLAMQNAANNYLKLCAERGIAPKFSHEKADFTAEDNYWKLLIDRKMVNNVTGEIIEQQSIKPIFDEGEVLRILNDELERYPSVKADQDYATRKVTEKFLSGEIKSGMSAEAIAKVMKTPVDNITKTNIVASVEGETMFSERGYSAVRETLAKQGLDELSKKLGSYFPLSASFDETMLSDETPLTMETVKAGSVQKGKKSSFVAGRSAFKNTYGTSTSVHIEQMGVDAVLYQDVAGESISKVIGQEKGNVQVILDVIPHIKDILSNSVLMSVERIEHTSGKGTALYGYRLYNLYWYQEGNKKTPHCLVCTVVQTADKAEGYVFRDIENVTIDLGLPSKDTGMPESVNDDEYNVAQLYRFVKGVKRDDGGIKYSAKEKAKYGFSYTQRNDGVLYSERDYAPTFYSQMGKVIDGVKQEKLAANSVVNMLRGKGVKAEEIRWSGIVPFLEGKKSVTKEELQEFVAGSMLQIGEQMSSNGIDLRYDSSKHTYTLYGKDGNVINTYTYNEFMGGYISENDDEVYTYSTDIEDAVREEYGNMSSPRWADYRLDGGSNYREIVFSLPNATHTNRAMKAHWGQDAEGILVHARIQDFDVNGKKMLFIEELQSDWHNEGHSKGYSTKEYEDAVETHDTLYNKYKKLDLAFHKYIRSNDFMTDPEDVRKKKSDWLRGKVEAAQKKYLDAEKVVNSLKEKGAGDTPNAPFKDTYHEFVLKRLLRMAAEQGYDSIGWTPADIQSKRWSDEFAEGYRIEYDQEMPKFLKKYGRQWGAKVEKSYAPNSNGANEYAAKRISTLEEDIKSYQDELKTLDENSEYALFIREGILDLEKTISSLKEKAKGIEIWSMPIPDSMKQSVLYEGQVMYSDRDPEASNRSILANALEGTAQNDIERNKLAQYKEKIDLINAEEKRLSEIQKQLFTKGAVEPEKRKELQFEAKQISNRINTYDRQLLNLEATTALKNVLNREKALAAKRQKQKDAEAMREYKEKVAKTTRELMTRNQESRKKAIESRNKTAMRHKIHKVVSELNTLLTHGNKKKHVPEDLKAEVAEVLELFNMDTVGAEERIAKLKEDLMKAKTPESIQEISRKIDHIQEMGDRFDAKLKKLKSAYDVIKSSADPDVAGGFDDVVSNRIEYVASKVGKTPIRYMTLEQLEMVYDVYTMVLNNIREANHLFKKNSAETIQNYASRVVGEVKQVGGKHDFISPRTKHIKEFLWNNLKPIFAFEKIGSKTLTDLYEDVRSGEDTWAVDVTEAKSFADSEYDKYNYKKWDLDKKYTFETSTGEQFSLTLEQILSLYAYSKRPQADEHLRIGGFVFDDSITTYKEKVEEDGKKKKSILKYKVNTASAHQISVETLADIVGKLTDEQKSFVDEMQAYLSDVMGAKGNEVSMALYNVRLFKEKNYFPLKSAKQFMFEQNEVAGEVKIKNSGFTESTVEHANNPIILSNFMDVWANHVNDMAMYHSFVLPLENFNRVFNYQTRRAEGTPAVSVKETLQNAYGTHAVSYIRQLLTDLNGGARSDPRESTSKKLISTFKKAKVFTSLSVVIQQPSAVARALALIDAKYFDFNPKLIKHKERWEELKKYAPVTFIKEMGHFDTDMGMSTVDYIKGQKTVMQKVDDVLSKAPSYADELTWVHIWEAVKRETKANRTDLKVGSEEFLKAAGKRFTEVISKTQVYDSVLSKSANMRSKTLGMNMLTAFMAEPTTAINMVEQGFRLWKRGYKRLALKQLRSVGASVILNAALVSLIYAMRDDDEDESYLEKYLGSFVSETIDGILPFAYYPIVKDVWSLLQGYSVERTDMSLISDAIDAVKGIVETAASYDEDMTDEEMREYEKSMVDCSLQFVDGIAAMFGISSGNIRREVNAIINTYKTATNGFTTSGLSLEKELVESVKGITPVWGWLPGESKQDKLYDAIICGDTAYVNRLKSGYKDDEAYETAVRKALRENDPRIKEAAEANYAGRFSTYESLIRQITSEGHFSEELVTKAIQSDVSKLKSDSEEEDESDTEDKATSIYKSSDINTAFENGDKTMALKIIDDIVEVKIENYINDGESKEEADKKAKSSVRSTMTTYWKPLYLQAYKANNSSEMKRIREILYASGLYGRQNEVVKDVQQWVKDSKKDSK